MLPGNKRIFVVGYHQSPFGKLGAMTLSEMIHDAVLEQRLMPAFPLMP